MDTERHAQLQAIYLTARARTPGERAAFLDDACSNDPELRVEVERRLTSTAEDSLETSTAIMDDTSPRDRRLVSSDGLVGMVLDGKYRIEGRIGQGGMGTVFIATHLGTSRRVAVKVIVPQWASDQHFLERFKREAEVTGRLRHPNIVDVTDFGSARIGDDTVAYLVMEYLAEGRTLADAMREVGAFPVEWAIDVLEHTCAAVQEAHQSGIVHRDLKPHNIWLEPNRQGGHTIKVLDFGLARLVETEDVRTWTPAYLPPPQGNDAATQILPDAASTHDDSRAALRSELFESEDSAVTVLPAAIDRTNDAIASLTRAGAIMGSPLYMSPEQCRGESADARSDIYSLGVIAYEMLAGERPLHGKDAREILAKHISDQPIPLYTRRPSVPRRLSDVVMAALEKDPDDRPPSAAIFASMFAANAEGLGALLSRAGGLLTGHFSLFLRLFGIAYVPYLLIRLLILIGAFSGEGGRSLGLGLYFMLFGSVGLFVANVVARGTSAVVIAQLLTAPERRVSLRLSFGVLRERLVTFAAGSSIYLLLVSLPLFVGVLVGITLWVQAQLLFAMVSNSADLSSGAMVLALVAAIVCGVSFVVAAWSVVNFAFLPGVLATERLGIAASIGRSGWLSSRLRRTLLPIAIVEILVFMFSGTVLPAVAAELAFGDRFGEMLPSLLSIALDAVAAPLLAVSYALLYLRARQANGESLDEVLNLPIVKPEPRFERR